jgi:uncharacterized protein
MGISKKTIKEIVKRVLSVSPAERIIIFGSAATGKMTRDSDIDLLVIEPAPKDLRRRNHSIHSTLRGIGYPVDVIVMGSERFEETKNVIGGISYPAHKFGKVIYEDPGASKN